MLSLIGPIIFPFLAMIIYRNTIIYIPKTIRLNNNFGKNKYSRHFL